MCERRLFRRLECNTASKTGSLFSYVCRIVRNLAIKKYHANAALKRNSIYDVCLDEIVDYFPSASSVEEELTHAKYETIDKTMAGQQTDHVYHSYWRSTRSRYLRSANQACFSCNQNQEKPEIFD